MTAEDALPDDGPPGQVRPAEAPGAADPDPADDVAEGGPAPTPSDEAPIVVVPDAAEDASDPEAGPDAGLDAAGDAAEAAPRTIVAVPDTDAFEAARVARALAGGGDGGAARPSWPPPEALEPDARRPIGADTDEIFPPPDLPQGQDLEGAFAQLEIRTPPEELEVFARARVDALARLGQGERAARLDAAARLALAAVRRAMGATPREAP